MSNFLPPPVRRPGLFVHRVPGSLHRSPVPFGRPPAVDPHFVTPATVAEMADPQWAHLYYSNNPPNWSTASAATPGPGVNPPTPGITPFGGGGPGFIGPPVGGGGGGPGFIGPPIHPGPQSGFGGPGFIGPPVHEPSPQGIRQQMALMAFKRLLGA